MSRQSRSISSTISRSSKGGSVRAIATSTSRKSTSSDSGQWSTAPISGGSSTSPVARSQRRRDSSASALAAGPVMAVVASCQGMVGSPRLLMRRGSWGRCSEVSQRSSVASMPPQKASASSATTIFWWWQAPKGWWLSSAKWMRSPAKTRSMSTGRTRPGATTMAPFHFRNRISRSGARSMMASVKAPSWLGRPSGARPFSSLSPGSISISRSKSQPISRSSRLAEAMTSRRARK